MSLRTIVKQSQDFEIATLRYASLAMTNIQLILFKYLVVKIDEADYGTGSSGGTASSGVNPGVVILVVLKISSKAFSKVSLMTISLS